MKLYSYNGPVRIFGNCVNSNWHGETRAPSERKARSNLSFQYKQETHRSKDAKVTLTGKIQMLKGE